VPNAEKTLFIGGGPAAAGRSRRFPLKEIIFAEQDEKLVELYKAFAGTDIFEGSLRFAAGDPRELVKKSGAEYDCIVINGSLPVNARNNRFYTVEFFSMAQRALKEGGILSLSVEASGDYLSPPQVSAFASVYKSLLEVFKNVKVIPGGKTVFLASGSGLDMNYRKLLKDAGMENDTVSGEIVSNTSPLRLKWMEDALSASSAGENRDLRPLAYYYAFYSWAETFGHLFGQPLRLRSGQALLSSGAIAWAVFLFALVFISAAGVLSGRHSGALLLSTAVTGFSALFFQIILMVVFQIIYGQLYYRMGLIATFFMAGLAAGSFTGSKKNISRGKAFSALLKTQALYIFFPLLFVFYMGRLFDSSSVFTWKAGFFFMALPFVYAFPSGLRFPLAVRLESGKNFAGKLYAADLSGSALGALLGAAVLIPALGIYKSCLLAALLNLIALIRLFSYNQKGGLR